MLIILKDLLAASPNLRLILMSATLKVPPPDGKAN
jgi:HrpA-like RNA helicase